MEDSEHCYKWTEIDRMYGQMNGHNYIDFYTECRGCAALCCGTGEREKNDWMDNFEWHFKKETTLRLMKRCFCTGVVM